MDVALSIKRIEHSREIYNIMDLIGDLGGVMEIITTLCGIFIFPISEHSFTLKALESLYLGRTKDKKLFKKSNLKRKN